MTLRLEEVVDGVRIYEGNTMIAQVVTQFHDGITFKKDHRPIHVRKGDPSKGDEEINTAIYTKHDRKDYVLRDSVGTLTFGQIDEILKLVK